MNAGVIGPTEPLQRVLAGLDPTAPTGEHLSQCVTQGVARLPMPGSGATLHRWQALAAVAAHDLSLAKFFEGHTDAWAILDELGSTVSRSGTWGVWASETPGERVTLEELPGGAVRLEGLKRWCSGAACCSHALLTAWHADGAGPQLVAIELSQPGVSVSSQAWQAVGMAASASLDVHLQGARGQLVGRPGEYLSRPGFWQGGAGIAACWFGGARALADALRCHLVQAPPAAHNTAKLAALGHVDVAMESTAALLREAACWIDQHPRDDASEVALRVRLSAEGTATQVLDQAGRALGATPFCRDAHFARMAADLPVFVRQSHGERDFAALGERVLTAGHGAWQL